MHISWQVPLFKNYILKNERILQLSKLLWDLRIGGGGEGRAPGEAGWQAQRSEDAREEGSPLPLVPSARKRALPSGKDADGLSDRGVADRALGLVLLADAIGALHAEEVVAAGHQRCDHFTLEAH